MRHKRPLCMVKRTKIFNSFLIQYIALKFSINLSLAITPESKG